MDRMRAETLQMTLPGSAPLGAILLDIAETDWRPLEGWSDDFRWLLFAVAHQNASDDAAAHMALFRVEGSKLRPWGSSTTIGSEGTQVSGWGTTDPETGTFLLVFATDATVGNYTPRFQLVDHFSDGLHGNVTPIAPLTTGEGTGISLYVDFDMLPFSVLIPAFAHNVEVEDDRSVGGVGLEGLGRLRLSATHNVGSEGVTSAFGAYSAAAGLGEWSVTRSVDGEEETRAGTYVGTGSAFWSGYGIAAATGGFNATSEAALQVEGTPGKRDFLFFTLTSLPLNLTGLGLRMEERFDGYSLLPPLPLAGGGVSIVEGAGAVVRDGAVLLCMDPCPGLA